MILIWSIVIVLVMAAGAYLLRLLWRKVFKNKNEAAVDFWKVIVMPLATPALVALLGALVFSYFTEAHYDNDKKVELLRGVLASSDRPDIAFLTAVGDHLVLHLKRWERIRKSPNAKDLESAKIFEERAVYFFYGMFHAALVDFRASKGYQLYPRLWMEEAFDRLADQVDRLASDQPNLHLGTVGKEEAALYKYFGAAAGTFKNITDRSGEPAKSAVLFDFNLMLDSVVKRPDLPQDKYQIPFEDELRSGCTSFQARLNHRQVSDPIDVEKLELTIVAITALDDYAFNKLFGVWYQGSLYQWSNSPKEVDSLTKEIPGKIEPQPPEEYIFYPLRGWEEVNTECLRKKTWKIIFDSVDSKFGGGARRKGHQPVRCDLAAK